MESLLPRYIRQTAAINTSTLTQILHTTASIQVVTRVIKKSVTFARNLDMYRVNVGFTTVPDMGTGHPHIQLLIQATTTTHRHEAAHGVVKEASEEGLEVDPEDPLVGKEGPRALRRREEAPRVLTKRFQRERV